MIIIGKFDCGCPATEDDGEGNDTPLKTYTIDKETGRRKNTVRYSLYCNDCYKQAVEAGCVAMTDEEEIAWIRRKE